MLWSGLVCASTASTASEANATAEIAVAAIAALVRIFMTISFDPLAEVRASMSALVRSSEGRDDSLTSVFAQPFNGADLLEERQIDVLVPDQLVEGVFDLVVLVVLGSGQLQAMSDAVLRQVGGPLLAINRQKHGVADEIAADGDAQQVEIALGYMRADSGEINL